MTILLALAALFIVLGGSRFLSGVFEDMFRDEP